MSNEPQLFRVNPGSQESERIAEADFGQLGLQERRDIQEWVAANPGILSEGLRKDLRIIGKEFSGFDRTNERLDLLAVDPDGKLVIIELKRDDTGADAHWQAIKYASYFHHAGKDDIIRMMAVYEKVSQEEATDRLLEYLEVDDLNAVNNDQRIILASHRFAPEVTSAALWLNEKTPVENLITCVKLTPYRDAKTDALYVQATTIIPVPGIDEYVIGVGDNLQHTSPTNGSNFAKKLQATFDRNKGDEVTAFVRKVGELTLNVLPDGIRPDKKSRWAGGWPQFRNYHLWYSRSPWRNHRTFYHIHLRPQETSGIWQATIGFKDEEKRALPALDGIRVDEHQTIAPNGIYVTMDPDTLNDDYAEQVANLARKFIERITPVVNDLENESNESDV